MSRLLDPGPGEILDRLTILSLKLLYGQQAGRDVTHWQTERDALWTQLTGSQAWVISAGLYYADLAAVNAALWQAEDRLREWREMDDHARERNMSTIATLGCRIQVLNDRRAALVTLINAHAGLDRPQEKC